MSYVPGPSETNVALADWVAHISLVNHAIQKDGLAGFLRTVDAHDVHTRPSDETPHEWAIDGDDSHTGYGGSDLDGWEDIGGDATHNVTVEFTPDGYTPHSCYIRVRAFHTPQENCGHSDCEEED